MNTIVAPQEAPAFQSAQVQLLEHLSTAVLLLDGQLHVQYANHAAEQLLATSLPYLRQQPFHVFLHAQDYHPESLRQALQTHQSYVQREARLRSPGHLPLGVVDYTVTPLPAPLICPDVSGESAGHQAQLLIELHRLDRLIHTNREDSLFTANQATRALVRGMAHEIKNPLGGIRGAAQLLERQLDSEELREYTGVIIHEADRLRALADRMLGARQPPAFTRVNIHQILERVRRVVQAEVGDALTVVRDYDPSLPDVRADADQLIQVFLNIVGNAAQCLLEQPQGTGSGAPLRPDGQAPRIIIRSRVLRRITIGTRCHPLLCLVEVEDNGPGISAELRETVFYPMVTGRSKGTGLGLPIAQAIMQQHGGLIECESQPGQTIFKILVPFDSMANRATEVSPHAQP